MHRTLPLRLLRYPPPPLVAPGAVPLGRKRPIDELLPPLPLIQRRPIRCGCLRWFGHAHGRRSRNSITEDAEASIPRLAAWLVRFLDAMGNKGPVMVAGHDIGGGVAQHLLVSRLVDVPRLALVNAVMYDSWPVPGVARFRDPAVAAATSTDDVLAARRQSVIRALARPASEAEIAEYLEPWTNPRIARSWLALAGAADNRYTLELLPGLRESTAPKLLVWGEDDSFQTVDYAERFAAEIPVTRFVRIRAAGHIPMENDPAAVARALGDFFTEH